MAMRMVKETEAELWRTILNVILKCNKQWQRPGDAKLVVEYSNPLDSFEGVQEGKASC